MRLGPRSRGRDRSPLLVLLSLGALAALGAWVILQRLPAERRAAARFWRGQLAATANGRGLAVSRWMKDAVADARVMGAFPSAQAALAGTAAGADQSHHVSEVLRLTAVQLHLRSASLVDRDGVERTAVDVAPGLPRAARVALARRACALGSELVDVQVDPGRVAGILVAVPAPGLAGRPEQAPGCVVTESDPEDFLFPLVRQSLGESTTAEVVLWRRDGADAVVLAPLRHTLAAEGAFRRPFGSGLFAPAAGGPEPAFQEPVDYRGIPVLAAQVSLPYGWNLAVKIDRSEALADADRRAAWQAAAVAGLALAGLTAAWLAPRLYRARARATLLASRAQIGQLLEQANDALLFSDSSGRIVQANPRAEHMYGFGPGGLVGRSLNELRTPEESERLTGRLERVRQRGGVVYESIHRRADGAPFPVEVSARSASDGDEDYYVAVVRDVSERRAAAARLELLNRTYRTLGEVNALLVRERDAQPLFEGVCRILVEVAGFPLAWAGVKRPDGRVEVKARHGATAGVDGLELRWDQGPESEDPVGRALSSGIPTAVEDFDGSQALAPSSERARAHGLSTCAVFPIWIASEVRAALVIYGSRPASLSQEDRALLQKTADGIGFALEALETEGQRRTAVEELQGLNAELERRVAERTSELEAAHALAQGRARTIEDLYNGAPCGYHSLDADGRILAVNDTELGWLGYAREELVGRVTFRDLMDEGSRVAFDRTFPHFKEQGQISNLELGIVRRDGSTLSALLSATAVRDDQGRFLHSRSTMIDFGEVKRAREQAAERARELEATNSELEAFSYTVSHDLRQPLRAVREYAGILERDHGKQLVGEGLRLLGVVTSAARRMDRLIEDLLAFARVKRQALRQEAVDMGDLARSALEELERAPHVEVRLSALPPAVGDPALLKQVWANLLSNALKFSRGTAARIEVGSRADVSNLTYFVSDNGVGFPPEHRGRLFGPFQRLHPPGEFEGTGLGLAIVARIVARHGGRVWAESTPGEGATFSFALPIPRAPA